MRRASATAGSSLYDLYNLKVAAEVRADLSTHPTWRSATTGALGLVGNYLPGNLVLLDARDCPWCRVIGRRPGPGLGSARPYTAPPRHSFVVALEGPSTSCRTALCQQQSRSRQAVGGGRYLDDFLQPRLPLPAGRLAAGWANGTGRRRAGRLDPTVGHAAPRLGHLLEARRALGVSLRRTSAAVILIDRPAKLETVEIVTDGPSFSCTQPYRLAPGPIPSLARNTTEILLIDHRRP